MGDKTRPSSVSLISRRTPDVKRCFSRRCRGITTWPLEDTVVVAIATSYPIGKMDANQDALFWGLARRLRQHTDVLCIAASRGIDIGSS